jgi:hypothetical protein
MDVLINSLIVCFGVGFISSLQVWVLYRQSYVQLQIDELIQSIEYLTDTLQEQEDANRANDNTETTKN